MEESLSKKYYKIREVSELLDLPASTLRFWESQFPMLKIKRNEGGTRFYTSADLEKLKMIRYLVKDKGLKIEAAMEQLRHNHSGLSRLSEAIERLRDVRSQLQAVLDSLNRLR